MSLDPYAIDPANPDVSTAPDDQGNDPFQGGPKTLNVPGNIASWIREVAGSDTGFAQALAAAIYLGNTRRGWTGVDQQVIQQAAEAMRGAVKGGWTGLSPNDPQGGAPDWNDIASKRFGVSANAISSYAKWGTAPDTAEPVRSYKQASLQGGVGGATVTVGTGTGRAAPMSIQDVYDYFQQYVGRDPSESEAQQYVGMSPAGAAGAMQALPEAAVWRRYGTQVKRDRSWITSIYQQYTGQDPTTEQMIEAVKRGYNQTTLEQYLSARPIDPNDPSKGTLGQQAGIRDSATRYAEQYLGRPADPGEVSFMLQNGITTPDQVSSFYEQMKQRKDTGDPSFAWVGNPQQWRDVQSEFASLWKQAGMTSQLDPHLVNQAIAGNWGKDDIQNYIDQQPAPGFPQGVTVGEMNRIRPIAKSWKDHYAPGQTPTNAELAKFLGLSSEQIRDYYGALPKSLVAGAKTQGLGSLTDPSHLGLAQRGSGIAPWETPPASAGATPAAPAAPGGTSPTGGSPVTDQTKPKVPVAVGADRPTDRRD